jgi:hypothetical protein
MNEARREPFANGRGNLPTGGLHQGVARNTTLRGGLIGGEHFRGGQQATHIDLQDVPPKG